jgi:hypothetical protein
VFIPDEMVCTGAAALITQKVKKYIPKQGLRLATRSEGPSRKFHGEIASVPACLVDLNLFGVGISYSGYQGCGSVFIFLRIRIRIRIQSLMLEANTDPDLNPDPDPDPDPIRIQGL